MASGTIKTQTAKFMQIAYTSVYSITADGTLSLKASDFKDGDNNPVATPTGYTPIALKEFRTGSNHVGICQVYTSVTGENTMMVIRELTSSAGNDLTARIVILYAQSEYVT